MPEAYICDGIRTPIGRYGGALSGVRPDDLAALTLRVLMERNPKLDPARVDDVILGCANQAGEDNRNVGRMAVLLAGLPASVPGVTLNRLCGSGLDALASAARMIRSGEAGLVFAGGVESMSRAPFVLGKSQKPFDRRAELEDTTMGWRFVNPKLVESHGVATMPGTAENVAARYGISRDDQDAFALRSQQRTADAISAGRLQPEIAAVLTPDGTVVERDEHPRPTSADKLAKLRPIVRDGGTVTAGNSSGINDGAAALVVATEEQAVRHGLTPRVRIVGGATAGVEPNLMGIGPVASTRRLLQRLGLSVEELDVIELNEAFAAQALAVARELGLADDAACLNPNGGAIALGHPLGMSGARLALTAMHQLERTGARHALCTMCIGVGQGISLVLERI